MNRIEITRKGCWVGEWDSASNELSILNIQNGKRYFAGSKDGPIRSSPAALKEYLNSQIDVALRDLSLFKEDFR